MQNTSHLLMVEPANFGFNEETAVNNVFQNKPDNDVQAEALKEFSALVLTLRQNGIAVTVITDTITPATPDSIFPNNWISFHDDGRICLYPMFAMNRRNERKARILDQLALRFQVSETIDLTNFENENEFLEGTGSLVLDRQHKIAYACFSPRTCLSVLDEFCRRMNYSAVTFSTIEQKGLPIYHTNVMMCVAAQFAVVCLDCISTEAEKSLVRKRLHDTNKEIIEISLEQLECFAGNMLQVGNGAGELFTVMSSRAFKSLTPIQISALVKFGGLIHSPLDTIENAGGGSARCMIAEIFNPPR